MPSQLTTVALNFEACCPIAPFTGLRRHRFGNDDVRWKRVRMANLGSRSEALALALALALCEARSFRMTLGVARHFGLGLRALPHQLNECPVLEKRHHADALHSRGLSESRISCTPFLQEATNDGDDGSA